MIGQVVREPFDLLSGVNFRNRRQNRLVKSSADQFNLVSTRELPQHLEILWARRLEPFQQDPGIVQSDAERRMPEQKLNKWQVGFFVSARQYVFKIADRLVCVKQERQLEPCHDLLREDAIQDTPAPAEFPPSTDLAICLQN